MSMSTPSDVKRFRKAAEEMAESSQHGENMAAADLVRLLDNTGFLSTLGYGPLGRDRRLEKQTGPGEAEFLIRSFTGGVVALVALQTPGADLNRSAARFKQHVRAALGRAKATVIQTNGRALQLFNTEDGYLQGPAQEFDLAKLSDEQASFLYSQLREYQMNWGRQLRHLSV
jgi:hypothetical protein